MLGVVASTLTVTGVASISIKLHSDVLKLSGSAVPMAEASGKGISADFLVGISATSAPSVVAAGVSQAAGASAVGVASAVAVN